MTDSMPSLSWKRKTLSKSLFERTKRNVDESLKKSIQIAIEQNLYGFRGGWVSSEVVRDLVMNPVHGPTLVKALQSLGYNFVSRVNTSNGRVRLYHVHQCNRMSGRQILTAFEEAQAAHMPEPTSATIRMPEPTHDNGPWRDQ